MPLPNLPRVNGQSFQHATVAPVILSDGGRLPLNAFKSIKYGVKVDKKPVKDSQGHDTGQWTLGVEDKSGASIEILRTEWVAIKKLLAVAYPTVGIGQIVMDWNVSYGNTPGTQITDKLYGVMFNDDQRDSSDSQDALYTTLSLFIGGDIIDGATGKPFVIYGAPAV
jgi:hypothetical protein